MTERAAAEGQVWLDRIGTLVLLRHGGQDTVATVGEVEAVAGTLRLRGVPCDLHIVADDRHGLNRHITDGSRLVADFFRRHVA